LIVYKITYPNGKIYVGKDETDTLTYFGSVDSNLVAADFTETERDNFSITKETLWRSVTGNKIELAEMEKNHILRLKSNDPDIGYNRWPKFARVK